MKVSIKDYKPIQGFYDLREFKIGKRDFLKLWKVQKFLCKKQKQRQEGFISNLEWEKLKEFSAKYQAVLFSFETKEQLYLF